MRDVGAPVFNSSFARATSAGRKKLIEVVPEALDEVMVFAKSSAQAIGADLMKKKTQVENKLKGAMKDLERTGDRISKEFKATTNAIQLLAKPIGNDAKEITGAITTFW